MPPSTQDWNNLFNTTAYVAVAALAVVMAAMVYFTVRYRQRQDRAKFLPEIGLSKSRARDAVVFACISIIILVSLSIASYRLTPNARFPPTGKTVTIDVTAFQWGFIFNYTNGKSVGDTVNVPENTSIIFNVTSIDVMHNFYLVDYRVSIDAIPGRYNVIWVNTPPLDGNNQLNYTIVCKELCGPGHTDMRANLVVMSQSAFNQWLVSNQTASAANSTMTSMPGINTAGG